MSRIWTDEGFVDCSNFLNSVGLYRFEDLEDKSIPDTRDLHGALFSIYRQVQDHDIVSLTMNTDYVADLGFNLANVSITLKQPINQPIFVFDMKLHEGVFFIAAYYSVGNQFAEICQQHGFSYSEQRKLWFYKQSLADENIELFLKKELAEFFICIKSISRIFFYRSTQQKYFRVK